MKKNISLIFLIFTQVCMARFYQAPSEFLMDSEAPLETISLNVHESFASSVDHLMDIQQSSLDQLSDQGRSLKLTQIMTSFSVSKSGLFGLSTLSTNSSTTLF